MTDNEIREAVEKISKTEIAEAKEIKTLLSLAELYLQAAEGMPERKIQTGEGDESQDGESSFRWVNGFNEARSLCIAAFARKMDEEKIAKIAEEVFIKESKIDQNEVQQEVNKHGLSDVQSWDNKEAGFFDMKGYFNKVAQAIIKELI